MEHESEGTPLLFLRRVVAALMNVAREKEEKEMVGEKEIFTVVLLKQTTDKAILDKGPMTVGFWTHKWTRRIKLTRYSQQIIVRNLYLLLRQHFHLTVSNFIRIYPYLYADSPSRTSLWAWVSLKDRLLHCHVESAASYA